MNEEPQSGHQKAESYSNERNTNHSSTTVSNSTDQEAGSSQNSSSENQQRRIQQVPKLVWRLIDHPKLVALGGMAVVLCSIAGLAITIVQYQLSVQNGIDSGKQTDRIIANSTEIAESMKASLGHAHKALDASIESSRMDNRAWITSHGISFEDIVPGKTPKFNVFVINSGKSPAFTGINTLIKVFDSSDEKGLDAELAKPWLDESGGNHAIMYPGQELRVSIEGEEAISGETLAQIKLGSKILYIIGVIPYRDIYGVSHRTKFCLSIKGPDLQSLFARKGNSAD
jgi:hypothetical protein